MLLENKVAIITGASRGIGRAIALRFAKEGAQTVITARGIRPLEDLSSEIEKAGYKKPLISQVDVTKEQQIQELVDKALDKYNVIDILVNNAGVTKDGLFVRMSEQDWDDVLNTNLKGTFFFMRAVAKPMIRQRQGRIINMASVVALMGNPGQANYSASKAGIVALTKSAAKELASRKILVNAIAPGFIDTDMTRNLPQAVKDQMLSAIAVKKFGSVEDIAHTAVYLASDLSSYVTGQVITVDGGMVMR
jgi:3-oxoacyl-[acyl-carrier protein] reductase